MDQQIQTSDALRDVRYEIRGQLANRAFELEKRGYEIISLNIGNPGLFGFRTPETMRLAMIENLGQAEPYCHQKGIFPAREAVVMQQQSRGIHGVTADEVFIGNGVSELIDLSLRALLNPGDEVLVPSPDYPLWSAAVTLNGGKAVHYRCRRENAFIPDVADLEALVTDRTRAIVVINPNNPTGAVYDRKTLEDIAALAERRGLVVLSDEIYDQMVYDDAKFVPMATLVNDSVCLTYSGLSKVYRACGYRVGWCVFSGDLDRAEDYIHAMELLAALRLCSNVSGQWAVQTALGGFQSIRELVRPGGRLYQSREVLVERVADSEYLDVQKPMGAMYAFIRLDPRFEGTLDDQAFALELLEKYHVLVAPGSSFNTIYTDHFRVTTLPDSDALNVVFDRINTCLAQYA
ncbi:MAG TPA: aminotransferase class I/II-fold pyridoxal phosphate-dependent enzyme [Woeseiaceae bacterium]|jgi:alanine-synthesizing transaminase|nr:aminotransferase class I/II-fold pyridoxal phosphate-dependent enzyme [Woeseiaceae bacterium]